MCIPWRFSAPCAAFFASVLLVTGCSVTPGARSVSTPLQPSSPASNTAPAVQGTLHGGQFPVKGAQIYLLAASQDASPASPHFGYGELSTSLLTNSSTGGANGWHYVSTDNSGQFSIAAGTWGCTSGQEVYLYAIGGDTIDQNTTNPDNLNSAAGEMVVLGECGAGSSLPNVHGSIQINEVTTVAAAYALAGFATDATHISSPASGQGYLGIQNAVKNAALLADLNTGDIPSSLPANITIPSAMIYTIADILADCINTQNSTSAECQKLLGDEAYNGTPADTASATINMAKQPGTNVGDLYNSLLADQVWSGYIESGPPTDFAIGIGYSGGGLTSPTAIAIDASGNAWVTDTPTADGAVIVLGPQGTLLSGTTGYACAPALGSPSAIALGPSSATPETAWVLSASAKTVTGVPYGGGACTAVTSPEDHTDPTGWNAPISLAASNNLYVLDQGLSNLDSFSLSSGSTATWAANWQGFDHPDVVAPDGAGNIWVAGQQQQQGLGSETSASIYGIYGTGASDISTASTTANIGSGQDALAIGANQSLWFADQNDHDSVDPFSASLIANVATASAGSPVACPVAGVGGPLALAIDGIGNAWVLNFTGADIAALSYNTMAQTTTTLSPDGTGGCGSAPFGGYSGNGIVMPSSVLPTGIAVDPSGNVWVSVQQGGSPSPPVIEFIGMASPTVTPLADAAVNNKIGQRP